MKVEKVAAFSAGNEGGNPAGVVLCDHLPDEKSMQNIAADVGFSETAFACPIEGKGWRVRYFSPESEVPFCGHATIGLGAILAKHHGAGTYDLTLNAAQISVEGGKDSDGYLAKLQSPPTMSRELRCRETSDCLDLFGYRRDQLSGDIVPGFIHAGANHLVLALRNRSDLAKMDYEIDEGRTFMRANDLVTIMLVWAKDHQTFHVRNAFASGGVFEDPATGAAAAAFSGYLRDIGWPHKNHIRLIQGEDMGSKSIIDARFSDEKGTSINVSGRVRLM